MPIRCAPASSPGTGVVFAMESGPGGGGAVAVKTGGKGDVGGTHVVWKNSQRSRIGTPVLHDGRLYWVSSGVANCIDAATGEQIYKERLSGGSAGGGGATGGGSRRFGSRGGRGQDYSSPVIADGKLIYARRSGDVYVVKLGAEFEQLAVNRFDSAKGDFHATPAVAGNQLFIRGGSTLYCVSSQK